MPLSNDWHKFKGMREAAIQKLAAESRTIVLERFPAATKDQSFGTITLTRISIPLSDHHGDLEYGHERPATGEDMAWIDAAERLAAPVPEPERRIKPTSLRTCPKCDALYHRDLKICPSCGARKDELGDVSFDDVSNCEHYKGYRYTTEAGTKICLVCEYHKAPQASPEAPAKDERFKIIVCGFDELPPEVDRDDLSNNGSGSEYASYLLVYLDGKLLRCESSAMEPEDVSFYRDLRWISQAIIEAWEAGKRARLGLSGRAE